MKRSFLLGAGVAAAVVGLLLGSPSAQERTPTKDVERGGALFRVYCENCHGASGRGDGATARFLTVPPADLTRLSRDNAGTFPTASVKRTIDGRERVKGHGDRTMPIWGLSLQEPGSDANQEKAVRAKVEQLTRYLESIQRRRAE